MKKTMYEILGMIKDGKAPKKVKYINLIWEYDKDTKDYFNDDDNLWLICSMNSIGLIEREVEILEEENNKCTVETCCIGIEGLSKSLLKIKDDMKSIYENIDKVETLEEEKKIPAKLPYYSMEKYKKQKTKINGVKKEYHYLKKRVEDLHIKMNELLDYLKSKGEQ